MSATKQHESPRAGPTGPRRQREEYRQHRFRLRSGDRVSVRQLRREDAPTLAATVEQLSERSRYLRFHSGLPRLTEDMVRYLTDIDHHDHEALVAVPRGSAGIIVGVARFIRVVRSRRTAANGLNVRAAVRGVQGQLHPTPAGPARWAAGPRSRSPRWRCATRSR